jgi:hypothetical protein
VPILLSASINRLFMKNRDWLLKALSGLAVVALPFAAVGCSPSLNDPDYGPLTSTFPVSDIFSPSGFMGDGANPGYLTVDFDESHCKQPRPLRAMGRCYTFTYFADPKPDMPWAGAYWVFPTNSWGSRPGYAIDGSKFQQVRFSAALDMPTPPTKNVGGTPLFNGVAGGIDGQGFYGPACDNIDQHGCTHSDTIKVVKSFHIGTEIGSDFQQFHMPLAGMTANELVGAFAWSMDFPNDSCTCSVPVSSPAVCSAMGGQRTCPSPVIVHIDDIVWDTAPPPPTP